jgi:hypothetical protein
MSMPAWKRVHVGTTVSFIVVSVSRIHGGSITGDLQPNKMHDANWLALIDRHGPTVMSPEFYGCRMAIRPNGRGKLSSIEDFGLNVL